jgi:hypothetical protein
VLLEVQQKFRTELLPLFLLLGAQNQPPGEKTLALFRAVRNKLPYPLDWLT